MRQEDVAPDIASLAFDFFYWFSRFEYALKENSYLESHVVGSRAKPGWNDFIKKWESNYKASVEASALLEAKPETQVVGENDQLTWNTVAYANNQSELSKVASLLKTVRNNLFHGGKHGGAGWDDPTRTRTLLSSGKAVLDQLSQLASLEADYTQYY